MIFAHIRRITHTLSRYPNYQYNSNTYVNDHEAGTAFQPTEMPSPYSRCAIDCVAHQPQLPGSQDGGHHDQEDQSEYPVPHLSDVTAFGKLERELVKTDVIPNRSSHAHDVVGFSCSRYCTHCVAAFGGGPVVISPAPEMEPRTL